MKKRLSILLMLLTLLLVNTAAAQDAQTPQAICDAATPAEDPETREYDAPEDVLEADLDYRVIFCTGAGPVYVDLFETLTPQTVNNFVFLAENGYYNNTNFHRVIENFMAQAGDPTNTGGGGPGYQFDDEFIGFLRFDRTGLLAMANAGPGTNGSQFFLTTAVTDHLDFAHTIFGEVLTGQDNVESIDLRDPASASDPGETLNTVVIITDPAMVEVEYETPEPVTREDVEAAIEAIPDLDGLNLSDSTGIIEGDAVVENADEDLQESVEAFLAEYNHQYTARAIHTNRDCELSSIPFNRIGYTVHVFETAEDAAAAVQDEFLPTLIMDTEEYQTEETDFSVNPMLSVDRNICDESGSYVKMYRQVGRYITVAEAILTNSLEDQEIGLDLYLDQVVRFRVYENIFADVLRPEVVQ